MNRENENKYSFEILLDFVEGNLPDYKSKELEKYLLAHPIDWQIVQGIKMFYHEHGQDRALIHEIFNNRKPIHSEALSSRQSKLEDKSLHVSPTTSSSQSKTLADFKFSWAIAAAILCLFAYNIANIKSELKRESQYVEFSNDSISPQSVETLVQADSKKVDIVVLPSDNSSPHIKSDDIDLEYNYTKEELKIAETQLFNTKNRGEELSTTIPQNYTWSIPAEAGWSIDSELALSSMDDGAVPLICFQEEDKLILDISICDGVVTMRQTYPDFTLVDISSFEENYEYSLRFPNTVELSATHNSFFTPKGIGLKEFEISVYTPQGQLVWYSDRLLNGAPAEYWDGRMPEGLGDSDAFVWVVHKAKFMNGEEWSGARTGTITVIR